MSVTRYEVVYTLASGQQTNDRGSFADKAEAIRHAKKMLALAPHLRTAEVYEVSVRKVFIGRQTHAPPKVSGAGEHDEATT